jgi:hypothetical protein
VLVTFGTQLALVGWNRSGGPGDTLALTHHDLDPPSPHRRLEDEVPCLRFAPLDGLAADRAALARLGFDPDVPAGEAGEAALRRQLRRRVWFLVDTSAAGWREYQRRLEQEVENGRRLVARGDLEPARLKLAEGDLERARKQAPRAVILEVAADPAALRGPRADRPDAAVVPGSVGISPRVGLYDLPGPALTYPRLAVECITVPPGLRATIEALTAAWPEREDGLHMKDEPPFGAVVAWGRRGEPWVASLEPGPPPERPAGVPPPRR